VPLKRRSKSQFGAEIKVSQENPALLAITHEMYSMALWPHECIYIFPCMMAIQNQHQSLDVSMFKLIKSKYAEQIFSMQEAK
jgi:K+-transporting ATPase A subunit